MLTRARRLQLLVPRRGAAASPLTIFGANLMAWYESDRQTYQDDELTTLATANAAPVGGWKDLSGNNRHLTQANDSDRCAIETNALRGVSVIVTTGSKFLSWATDLGGATKTAFVVLKRNADGNQALATAGKAALFEVGGLMAVYRNGVSDTATYDRAKVGLALYHFLAMQQVINGASSSAKNWLEATLEAEQTFTAGGEADGGVFVGRFSESAAFFADIKIAFLAVVDRVATSDEFAAIRAYAASRFRNPASGCFALEGDSIMAGDGITTPFSETALDDMTEPSHNHMFAISGSDTGDLEDRADDVDAYLAKTPAGTTPVLAVLVGANDKDEVGFVATVKAYCLARKAATPGLKIVLIPILPQTTAGFNTWRNTQNAAFVADPSFYDAIVAQDASMWADAAASDVGKYSDGIHPTQAGADLMAPFVQAAYEAVLS